MARWQNGRSKTEGHRLLDWLYTKGLRLQPDGTVEVPAFGEPATSSALLVSRLGFHRDVSPRESYVLIRQAVVDALKDGRGTADGFLECVTEKENTFLSTPLRPYVLLTSLSAPDLEEMPRVRMSGATLTFSRYPPRHFKAPDRIKNHQWREKRFSGRTAVRVHVRERTPQDAFDLALDRLDLLRAFWNLGLHRGSWRISLGGSRPVNDVRLGPLHTIHHSTGEPALDSYWYEPEFSEDEILTSLGAERRQRMKAEEQWCRVRLARLKGRSAVEELFVRYCRALDQANQTNAFLQTWSILEDLTGNPRAYRDLVDRAAYLYTDRWYTRLLLKDMADLRNEFVHSGKESDRFGELVYQLKKIVEHYLVFILNRSNHFKSLEELALFLSQPTDIAVLQKREAGMRLARTIFKTFPDQ